MFLIDTTKDEFKDLPASLDGQILLEITKDSDGNFNGCHCIEPGILKYFAETKTEAELEELGFGNFKDKLDWVKTRIDIKSNPPEVHSDI